MGQRTQLVLKTKDRFGTVQTKVYHEQWGFAKTMPMIILEFLISLNYGSTGQRKYTESYRKPRIVDMRELNAMKKQELEETVKQLQETSIHNIKLNSYDISEEYFSEEYGKRYVYDNGEHVEVLNSAEVNGVKGIPMLEWDFDINNSDNVRQFTGDNNDGLALISVEEIGFKNEYGNRDVNYNISIGFLISDWVDSDLSQAEQDKQYKEVHRYHDLFSYGKQYGSYCPKAIMKAIAELYEYFEVNQLGKAVKEKAKV